MEQQLWDEFLLGRVRASRAAVLHGVAAPLPAACRYCLRDFVPSALRWPAETAAATAGACAG